MLRWLALSWDSVEHSILSFSERKQTFHVILYAVTCLVFICTVFLSSIVQVCLYTSLTSSATEQRTKSANVLTLLPFLQT